MIVVCRLFFPDVLGVRVSLPLQTITISGSEVKLFETFHIFGHAVDLLSPDLQAFIRYATGNEVTTDGDFCWLPGLGNIFEAACGGTWAGPDSDIPEILHLVRSKPTKKQLLERQRNQSARQTPG